MTQTDRVNLLSLFPEGHNIKSVVGRLPNPETQVRQLRVGFDNDIGSLHNRLVDFCPQEYELLYVLKGKGALEHSNAHCTPIQDGTIVQRFPGKPSTLRYDPPGQRVITAYLVVPASTYETLCISGGLATTAPATPYSIDRRILECFRELYFALRGCRVHELSDMAGRMYDGLTFIHNRIRGNVHVMGQAHAILESACALLTERLDEKIVLPEILEALHISEHGLRTLFAKTLHTTPGRYRIERRLERARDLLSSGRPQKEISERLGYTDVYAFAKQFKRFVGMTPGTYQRQADLAPFGSDHPRSSKSIAIPR